MSLITISFITMSAIVFIISIVYCSFYKGYDKNVCLAVEMPSCADCEIGAAIGCFDISEKDISLDAVL